MIAEFFAALIRLFTGVRTLPITQENQVSIYYARHQSHFDTLVIWAAMPSQIRRNLRPIAALDYWGKSAIRRWFSMRVLNAILIDRSPSAKSRHLLQPVINALSAGSSILIFPEGTRNGTDQIGSFKSGIYHLSRKCPDTHCIPIQLENLGRILPKGEYLPLPIIARISAAPPISLRTNESKHEFLSRCRNSLIS